MLDLVAREAGLEPFEVRMKNLVRPEQMPFDNITKKHFDSGDYPEALRRALDAADLKSVRERQRRGEPDGRLIGIGLRSIASKARMARRSTPAGAFRWCRGMSRRRRA